MLVPAAPKGPDCGFDFANGNEAWRDRRADLPITRTRYYTLLWEHDA